MVVWSQRAAAAANDKPFLLLLFENSFLILRLADDGERETQSTTVYTESRLFARSGHVEVTVAVGRRAFE